MLEEGVIALLEHYYCGHNSNDVENTQQARCPELQDIDAVQRVFRAKKLVYTEIGVHVQPRYLSIENRKLSQIVMLSWLARLLLHNRQ